MKNTTELSEAEAVRLAILLFELEAETAFKAGNGAWRIECINAYKALQRLSTNLTNFTRG